MTESKSLLPDVPLNRYGVTVAFWLTTADEGDAHTLVSNFVDSFPHEVTGVNADVLVQDTELIEEGAALDEQ